MWRFSLGGGRRLLVAFCVFMSTTLSILVWTSGKASVVGRHLKLQGLEAPEAAAADTALASFTLFNADNDQPIQTLINGTTINLATLPSRNLNIAANTTPVLVGSVVINLSGTLVRTQTETTAPYALFGDKSGDYNAWVPVPGSYTLKGTPYSAAGGSGRAGTALTVQFTVIDQPPVNQPPVADAGANQQLVLPRDSTVLSGSGSDNDGTIAAYRWSQLSGPGNAVFSSTSVAAPKVKGLAGGTYIFALTVQDNSGAWSGADEVQVDVVAQPSTGALLRINAGGAAVNTSAGNFSADQHFTPAPGYRFATTKSIAGTDDDTLYKSERGSSVNNGTFSYAIPLNNGSYRVVLHFAEIYFTATGRRVFDVSIEGQKVLDNYDIVRKVGGFTATTETFTTTVADGMLHLYFSSLSADGGVNRPKVSAIEVWPATSPANKAPVADAGPDQELRLPRDSVQLQGSGSDADGNITGWQWRQLSGPNSPGLGNSQTASPVVRGLVAGNYSFELVVRDNGGLLSAPDTVGVQVLAAAASDTGTIGGARVQWQPMQIDFNGPALAQTGVGPNPFLDYRLQVLFVHKASGRQFDVPGFFDGNGAGGGAGSTWRVRFTPDSPGQWTYKASFRGGADVAINLDKLAGTPAAFDGVGGSFGVASYDPLAPGFWRKGRLAYAGGHYFRFQDGSYFIKGGPNSPESFLGQSFVPHAADWQSGDPDWNGGAGKGIIGAINYLSGVGVNSIYFLTMNIGGDKPVSFPYVTPIDSLGNLTNDNLHFDLAKMQQWETIFGHAQRKGIYLHFVLSEAEAPNKLELDSATLGRERKLYYRELVARFGHHNALQWNLCEEYNYKLVLTAATIKGWAQYLTDLDPYDHPVTVHNYSTPGASWGSFVGDRRFSTTSFQDANSIVRRGEDVVYWRKRTTSAGFPIPISFDEVRSTSTTNMAAQRRDLLWPTYLSGGAGLEWYIGSADLNLQNFRTYEPLLRWTGYALRFVQEHLPFTEMLPRDSLVSGAATTYGPAQVFAKKGAVYAVYLPDASAGGVLNLKETAGSFTVRWFNPRTGQFEGTTQQVNGGAAVSLGPPPGTANEDWVVLVKTTAGATSRLVARNSPASPANEELHATLTPNPSQGPFLLNVWGGAQQPVRLRVYNLLGRLVEERQGLKPGGTVRIGHRYLAGTYLFELTQGAQRITLQAVRR